MFFFQSTYNAPTPFCSAPVASKQVRMPRFSPLFTLTYTAVLSITMLLMLLQDTRHSRSDLLISALGGFIRGFLVGLIGDGFDTGIITGATVAAINPLIISLENRLRGAFDTSESSHDQVQVYKPEQSNF